MAMDLIYKIFGEGKDLSVTQMCCRAAVVYFITLVLIRISGRRTFGKRSAFDNSIALILGAVISRAVVGASPFVPTVCSCLVLASFHRLLAWLSMKNSFIRELVKGENIMLFKDDQLQFDNMTSTLMNEKDVMSDVRTKANTDSMAHIKEIHMEASGEVSIVKKDI